MRIITEEKIRISGDNGKYRALETVERLINHINKGRMTKKNALTILNIDKQYLMEKVCGATDAEERAKYSGELEGIKTGVELIEETEAVLIEGQLFTGLEQGGLLSPCMINLRTRQIQGITRSECCPDMEAVIIEDEEFLVVDNAIKANIIQEEIGDTVFWY